MLARRQSNRESDSLLVGTQNGAASLEESLAVSSPDKHWVDCAFKLETNTLLGMGLRKLVPYADFLQVTKQRVKSG